MASLSDARDGPQLFASQARERPRRSIPMSMIESRLFQGGRLLRSNELFAIADESRCKQSGKPVDRIDPYQEADQPLAAPVGL
jgi:hypothetical protein